MTSVAYRRTATAPPPTLADLLRDLGDIPPERVRAYPPPGTATEEDLLKPDTKGLELVDGVLVEKVMAYNESRLAVGLVIELGTFLDRVDLGALSTEEGMMRLRTGLVRKPDIGFVRWDSLPNEEIPDEPIAPFAPDLGVEILSKGNTKAEIERKIDEYFRAGGKLVWVIDPRSKTVRVYTSPKRFKVLSESDTLDGGKVLPGFSLSIRRLFARASRRPRKKGG